ncbi:hypothetical protein [Kitasatospora sp. NPDC050543]|uniref:hypothetical protein n=1 Tax=Kitasatospora sp. NPDC050543 TaxID=3364054 RepID=UPI0037B4D423
MTTKQSLRRVAAAGAAMLAVSLLATPAVAEAAGGSTVSAPWASPRPATASTGVVTDACDPTTTPGWIGRTIEGPTLNATVDSPIAASTTGTTLSARFDVWDLTTGSDSSVFHGTADSAGTGRATLRGVTGLTDGHSYAWRARAIQGHRISAPTPDCHFRVDLTDVRFSVTSPDFPVLGSGQKPGKYAGQTGAFTITGADQAPAGGGEASGIACYRYALGNTGGIFMGCDRPDAVRPGPDGSVTLDLKVPDWGTNQLRVEAVDNAGNVSRTVTYDFYAPWHPDSPEDLGALR